MGYKGALRSIGASINRSINESEKRRRAAARQEARLQKIINGYNEKLEKIYQALEDVYAKGKITKDEYNTLKSRENDITIDQIAVGKQPYVSLAKRYITDKIDKNEYDQIIQDIFPQDYLEEKSGIEQKVETILNNLKTFKSLCKKKDKGFCDKCGSKQSLINWIMKVHEFKLCNKCRAELKKIQYYKGLNGKYFSVSPKYFKFSDIGTKGALVINFKI